MQGFVLHKENWRIVVKVIRLWISQGFLGSRLPYSLEMVFMDSKGCKIHATVKKSLIYVFRPMLTEGNTYSIANFKLSTNGGQFRTSRHEFKINFQLNTEVETVKQPTFSVDPFSFVPLAEIQFQDYDLNYLADVIGVLTGVGVEREVGQNYSKSKMKNIEIDSDGLKIECALFGCYVDELNSFLSAGDVNGCVVVLQFVKVKVFKGKVGLQNVHGATKLIFNPDIALANEMRERYLTLVDSGSLVLSQLCDSARVEPEEDFLNLNSRKTVAEIRVCKEDCVCVVLATVTELIGGEEWWYRACKCNKKVYPDENMFFCENCNHHVSTFIPRYRLRVRVSDDTDTASFVIFDHEATALIGKPCAAMIDSPANDGNSNGLPYEICAIVGSSFLFKVEVKVASAFKHEPSYTVKRVCSDLNIIQQFKASLSSEMVDSLLEQSLTTPTSQFTNEGSCSEVAKDLLGDFVAVSEDESQLVSSGFAVELGSNTQSMTPSKRRSYTRTENGKESNTVKKRLFAQIKKEKN